MLTEFNLNAEFNYRTNKVAEAELILHKRKS
jgi:hypothetical protein